MEKIKKECRKVAFYTLGCKVNQYETNAMIQKFIEQDYEIVDFNDIADIYIINTCTVTNMSDRKSRQMIRRAKHMNPESVIIAVGCYAQVAKKELQEIKDIDLILGNNEKNNIVQYVKKYIKNEKWKEETITDVMQQREFDDFGEVIYTEKSRAVIKVQDGCDRFCSYCIIPYARGRVRSRKLLNVIKEIEMISKKGIKEVVITGIHVASYGKDFKDGKTLIDLLEKINKIEKIERIRLGSLEPTIITKEFVDRLKKLEKICDHFHLSLQSGCDETLNRMNRKYSTYQFEEGVHLLRTSFPGVLLTTDVIVGFPGETKEEFEKTYEFLKIIQFYKMHIFKYSGRKGTKAYIMKDQIDANIKEDRSNRLIQLSNENEEKYNQKEIGKIVNVLFEEKEGEYIKGHTTNYKMIHVNRRELKEENLENKIKQVKITKTDNLLLVGELQ